MEHEGDLSDPSKILFLGGSIVNVQGHAVDVQWGPHEAQPSVGWHFATGNGIVETANKIVTTPPQGQEGPVFEQQKH